MVTSPVDIKKLDVLQAQINVSISQTRRLVDSWLPPAPSTAARKSAPLYSALPDDGSDELLKPKPPRLGLGATIPKHFYDDDQKLRKDISSVDLLKRRLLGSKRNASQISDKPTQHKAKHQNGNSSQIELECEEEEGRSALGKSKRPKVETEKAREGNAVKQKDEERKVEVEASSDLGKVGGKGLERSGGENKPNASKSNSATLKLHAPNGGVGAHGPRKKKKKKNKKNKNKQHGGNQNVGS